MPKKKLCREVRYRITNNIRRVGAPTWETEFQDNNEMKVVFYLV